MTNQIQISAKGSDITVNTKTGEAYISQRKLAAELGIHHSSLQTHLATRHPNLLFSEGIPSNILQETAIHFAYKSKAANTTAESFAAKLMEAGAKAYLYHEAGIAMNAVQQQRPLTQLEAFKELVRLEEERIALLETVSQQSGLLVQQKEVIDYKKIITGEGEEYFPISLILNHNEDRTFSGRRLAIFSAKAEIDPIPMFASKGQIPVKAYHWSVWEAAYPNVILPE